MGRGLAAGDLDNDGRAGRFENLAADSAYMLRGGSAVASPLPGFKPARPGSS
jgi:hypothetical protein